MSLLDAKNSRPLEGGASFSLAHRLIRFFWNIIWFLFAKWTPAPLHKWRVFILKCFGAQIDFTAHVYGTAEIWYPPNLSMGINACLGPRVKCYCMTNITVGNGSIVSQGAYLCAGTHDIEDKNFQLKVRPITIGSNVWIAAEAFIGPGVDVEDGAVLGARAVVFQKALSNGVYVGNPAKLLKMRKLYSKVEMEL